MKWSAYRAHVLTLGGLPIAWTIAIPSITVAFLGFKGTMVSGPLAADQH